MFLPSALRLLAYQARQPEHKRRGRLWDKKGGSSTPWNKLRPEEESKILAQARAAFFLMGIGEALGER